MMTRRGDAAGRRRRAGVPGSPERAWQLVAVREVTVKLTDKTFVFSTLGTVALIAALLGLQVYLADRTQTYTVVATAAPTPMAAAVRDGARRSTRTSSCSVAQAPDEAAAARPGRAGEADAWLHRSGDGWLLTTRAEARRRPGIRCPTGDPGRGAAAQRRGGGHHAEALERGSQLEADFLEGDAQQAQLAQAVGFAFALLFYIAALLFGVTLANSVLEEKQSRIVEIIATAVPLRQLLAGKVLGNMVIAVGQLGALPGGRHGRAVVHRLLGPGAEPVRTVAWFVLFFLAGFAVLACLWAVAGSLANRTEDLQATTAPLTLLTMAVFFAALFLEGQWAVAASFVPPLSAVLMPIRLLEQSASWWEAAIALAILLAAAAATIRVGERLYRRSLLQTGGRLSLRQAWTADT